MTICCFVFLYIYSSVYANVCMNINANLLLLLLFVRVTALGRSIVWGQGVWAVLCLTQPEV